MIDLHEMQNARANAAEVRCIRGIINHLAEFGYPLDPEAWLPPLAQEIHTELADLYCRLERQAELVQAVVLAYEEPTQPNLDRVMHAAKTYAETHPSPGHAPGGLLCRDRGRPARPPLGPAGYSAGTGGDGRE